MTAKTKARCSCVDNIWACEQHNPKAQRASQPLHFYVAATGCLCGRSGRSETSMSAYLLYTRQNPAEVCPTCALLATNIDAKREQDYRKLTVEHEQRAAASRMTLSALRESAPNFDPVSKPAHYNAGKVECIDALEAATIALTGIEAVCTANAIKYLWRHSEKNGTEDLEKCIWYVKRLIAARKARGAK